jgi:hypothetical protein
MPFDALVAAPRQRTISEALEAHGLTPVSWETLGEHKLEQQRKFGPSFWYRHQAMLSISLIVASPAVGAVVGATQGFTPHASALTIASSFVWMCMVALITGTGLIRLRAGSHWEERRVPVSFLTGFDVPEPIAQVARLLQDDVPRSRLILGELKRDEAVLDPYLLLESGDECVCLGIWEDGHVVACADTRGY